jgi:hypothetical protein
MSDTVYSYGEAILTQWAWDNLSPDRLVPFEQLTFGDLFNYVSLFSPERAAEFLLTLQQLQTNDSALHDRMLSVWHAKDDAHMVRLRVRLREHFGLDRPALVAAGDWLAVNCDRDRNQVEALPLSDVLAALNEMAKPERKCRLRIEGREVWLDDEKVPLAVTANRRDQILCYLGHLIRVEGDWISGADIDQAEAVQPNQGLAGVRWDRVKPDLPECLSSLIESKPGAGQGLMPSAWRK